MSKAMSLKAKIRNIAKQKNIPAQVILQNYMFERLLVRLSASEYKEKFVLKGGMLVAAIVGLDNRATMDMDTTLKNLPLTPEAIRSALEDVCDIAFDDGVVFEIGTISPIREDDIYGGYRVMLNAKFDTLLTHLALMCPPVMLLHPMRCSTTSLKFSMMRNLMSCGHTTLKPSWPKRLKLFYAVACSILVPEIFTIPIY